MNQRFHNQANKQFNFYMGEENKDKYLKCLCDATTLVGEGDLREQTHYNNPLKILVHR